jgi:hypothetical protein
MTAKLRIINQAEEPVDITRELRADIEKRDWSAVHVAGDRRAPVYLPDRVKRLWRR